MGQSWILWNVDRREEFARGQLGEWLLESDHSEGLLDELMFPLQLPRDYNKWLKKGRRATQRCPLFRIPNELFGMIFEELDEEDISVLCFAITCKDLLALAKQPLLKVINRATTPGWANCRLICLGEHLDGVENLPAGMLTADEHAKIQGAHIEDGTDICMLGFDPEYEYPSYPSVADLLRRVGGGSRTPVMAPKLRKVLSAMENKMFDVMVTQESSVHRRPKQRLAYQREVDMLQSLLFSPTKPSPEVLCNISKGEYVRRAALPDVALDLEDDVSLAHALIVQVFWSSDPSCDFDIPEEHHERILRGPWAGDRFCVTTRTNMPQLAPGIGRWRDVSDEVVGFLRLFLRKYE